MSDHDPSGGESSRAADRPFAEKLSRLFEVLHPVGARPLSTRAIAKKINDLGGSISPTYIGELRSGKKTSPSIDHCNWLAAAFEISPGYFTNDPKIVDAIDADLDRVEQLHLNPGLGELAEQTVLVHERTADLGEADRAALTELVEDIWRRRRQ